MSYLVVKSAQNPEEEVLRTGQHERIQSSLNAEGVRFERWNASAQLPAGADQDTVIAAYRADVDRLMQEGGYQSVDVVRLAPPAEPADEAKYRETAKAARQKFLNEHRHAEDEVRFFVEGSGLFYLHLGDRVFCLLCEQGDLVSVPAQTPHWFDMGSRPAFAAIRLFTNPDGWVAHFTGSDISSRFPTYDALVAQQ